MLTRILIFACGALGYPIFLVIAVRHRFHRLHGVVVQMPG
jgi:hypothetical protein